MVVSNLVSWHVVLAALASKTSSSALRASVWKIGLFYTLWALYNRYLGGRPQELGHVSFGLLTLSCLIAQYCCSAGQSGSGADHSDTNPPAAAVRSFLKILLLVSSLLVTLNFLVVLPMIASAGGPRGFAGKVWKGDTSTLATVWGFVFAAYVLSNAGLWSLVCYRFYKLPMCQNESDGDGALLTDEETGGGYEPLSTTADL